MGTKVRIVAGEVTLEAELNDSRTAQAILEALPFEGEGNRWGDEVYFEIPPFGRPPLEMAPHLQSIQAVGKSLLITGAMKQAELHSLLALLSPRGLAIRLSILPEGT